MAVQDLPIESMDFKALRAKVQEQEGTIARLKRTFEDVMYNIDMDNFSGSFRKEADNFRSEFTMTAKEIKMSVSALVGNMAELSVRADRIYSRVTNTITTEFLSDVMPTKSNTTDQEKTMLCKFDGVYYYYDDFDEEWHEYPEGGLSTCFVQDGTKFHLTGNVVLDGNCIVDGSLKVRRLYGPASDSDLDTSNFYAKIQSEFGDFGLFGKNASESDDVSGDTCIWGVYQSDLETRVMNMYASGNNYFGYSVPQQTAYPKGKWSFGSCTVVDWGSNRPVAVFA